MIPIAGSAYTYAYATLGEIFAWMIGWDLILEYAVGSMTVAIGWSGYFQRILAGFGIAPAGLDDAPRPGRPKARVINLPAVIIVLCITALLVDRRPRERALQRGDGRDQAGRRRSSSSPPAFDVRQARELVAVHAVRLLRASWPAAAVVFFAYIGFDAVSTTAEEAKNPQRDLPIGIIASLVICTLLYLDRCRRS